MGGKEFADALGADVVIPAAEIPLALYEARQEVHRLQAEIDRLRESKDALMREAIQREAVLRAEAVTDGHTRIDGKLWRVEGVGGAWKDDGRRSCVARPGGGPMTNSNSNALTLRPWIGWYFFTTTNGTYPSVPVEDR